MNNTDLSISIFPSPIGGDNGMMTLVVKRGNSEEILYTSKVDKNTHAYQDITLRGILKEQDTENPTGSSLSQSG